MFPSLNLSPKKEIDELKQFEELRQQYAAFCQGGVTSYHMACEAFPKLCQMEGIDKVAFLKDESGITILTLQFEHLYLESKETHLWYDIGRIIGCYNRSNKSVEFYNLDRKVKNENYSMNGASHSQVMAHPHIYEGGRVCSDAMDTIKSRLGQGDMLTAALYSVVMLRTYGQPYYPVENWPEIPKEWRSDQC